MRTIKLKKYLDVVIEREAQEDIKPGMLLTMHGEDEKVKKHDEEDGIALTMIALEDELRGRTVNDEYEEDDDDPVQVWIPQRGEEAVMILKDGNNVSAGDPLSSNGDGKLKEFSEFDSAGDVAPYAVVGVALEDKNASSSDEFIKVRIC